MHCQVSEMLIHLGSPAKSEKHTALISVDTLKSVSGWLLLFLRFYVLLWGIHGTFWQLTAAGLSSACKKVWTSAFKVLTLAGIGIYLGVNVFFFVFFITLAMLSCSVFTQYLIPVNTVSGKTGNTNTRASARGEAALVSGFGCIGDY